MKEFLEVCLDTTKAAGKLLMDRWGRVSVQMKGPADLVTDADFASQELVRQRILDHFPDHLVLGEEEDSGAVSTGQSGYRWIVDPLDGTTNYVHHVPHFSVSLALEHRGKLQVGAVYNPVANECFSAVVGEGAFLNGRPIRTSGVTSLSDALAAIGFPAVVRPESPDLRLFLAGLERCQAIRRTGSAALNLCYLAAGRFDVSWSFCTRIWDVAAGILIVGEAGGTVTSVRGDDFRLDDPYYLAAATPGLYAELRDMAARAGL